MLNLRAEAAETAVEAAKVFCKIKHHETVAAKFLVRRLELLEEAKNLTSRGKHYYDKMKEHQKALEKQKELKETLEPEIIRKRDKAVKLATQANAKEEKASEMEEKAREVLEDAIELKKERNKLIIQVRRLEADAVRAESSYTLSS